MALRAIKPSIKAKSIIVISSRLMFRRNSPAALPLHLCLKIRKFLRRLLKHLRDYPHLNIEWLPTGTNLNIIDEQIDIGIRIGTVPDNRFIVKCICPVGVT